jgi:alkylhydroperoxidase family enzyme
LARLDPAPAAQYAPLFGEDPPLRMQIYAQRPPLAKGFIDLGNLMRAERVLPGRLLELVRLRIAFHNQCRTCMAVRYEYDGQGPIEDAVVCSLERPHEAPGLTDAERAALVYADLMATNHHAVDDGTFAALREHFTDAEIMELCFHVAFYVGFGRMAMSLDMVEDLPEAFREEGRVTPWGQEEVIAVDGWPSR